MRMRPDIRIGLAGAALVMIAGCADAKPTPTSVPEPTPTSALNKQPGTLVKIGPTPNSAPIPREMISNNTILIRDRVFDEDPTLPPDDQANKNAEITLVKYLKVIETYLHARTRSSDVEIDVRGTPVIVRPGQELKAVNGIFRNDPLAIELLAHEQGYITAPVVGTIQFLGMGTNTLTMEYQSLIGGTNVKVIKEQGSASLTYESAVSPRAILSGVSGLFGRDGVPIIGFPKPKSTVPGIRTLNSPQNPSFIATVEAGFSNLPKN